MNNHIIILVATILAVTALANQCHADCFYCTCTKMSSQNSLVKVQLDYERRNEHNIVPEWNCNWKSKVVTPDGPCSWELYHSANKTTMILFEFMDRRLLGDMENYGRLLDNSSVSVAKGAAHIECHIGYLRFASNVTLCDKAGEDSGRNYTAGTFQVFPLLPGARLHLSVKPFKYKKSPVALRITAIDEGYCTRMTTHHRRKCHFITGNYLTLNETVQLMQQNSGTGMQMASFQNLSDILSFIKMNNFTVQLPGKQPLNFTRPVRIGIFSTNEGGLVRMKMSVGKCALETVELSSEFLPKPKSGSQCVSLTVVNSGSPAIELVDCNQLMPALISFPETHLRNSCLDDCSKEILEWVNDSNKRTILQPHIGFLLALVGIIVIFAISFAIWKDKIVNFLSTCWVRLQAFYSERCNSSVQIPEQDKLQR